MRLSLEALSWFENRVDYRAYFLDKKIDATLLDTSYWGFVNEISSATTLSEIHSICDLITESYGYHHFGLAVLYPKGKGDRFECHHVFKERSPWVKHYQRQHLLFADPFSNHCIKHSVPLLWTQSTESIKKLSMISPDMAKAFQLFNVSTVLSVPFHRFGGVLGCFRLLAFNHSQMSPADRKQGVAEIHSLTAHLMNALGRVLSNDSNALYRPAVMLTRQEKKVLLLLVQGLSAHQISGNLTISKNTVLTHTKNIYRKLGVNNRQVAVVTAIALGLVE